MNNVGTETSLCVYDDSGQFVWGRFCHDSVLQCHDPDALNCLSTIAAPSPIPSCDFPQECPDPDGGTSVDPC